MTQLGRRLALTVVLASAGALAADRYSIETIDKGSAWVSADKLIAALSALVADKPTAKYARKIYPNADGTFSVEEPSYRLAGDSYPFAHWRLGEKADRQRHLEGVCRYFGLKDGRSFLPLSETRAKEYVEMKEDGTLKEIHVAAPGYVLQDLVIPGLVVCGARSN